MKMYLDKKMIVLAFYFFLLGSCDLTRKIEKKAMMINNYERTALSLSKRNQELEIEISRLKSEFQSLRTNNDFLTFKLKDKRSRALASIAPVKAENDLVKFNTYKWKANKILGIAESSLKEKNFEKAAQFFHSLLVNYSKHRLVNDEVLFKAGFAASESKKHPQWVLTHFKRLIREYPSSSYYRDAKLWLGLTYLNQGHKNKFFKIVEEFRLKYRNTDQWKILSRHYEKIVQNYKK